MVAIFLQFSNAFARLNVAFSKLRISLPVSPFFPFPFLSPSLIPFLRKDEIFKRDTLRGKKISRMKRRAFLQIAIMPFPRRDITKLHNE